MKIAILGAGMVGQAMAVDLSKEHEVTAFDISETGLAKLKKRDARIHTTVANLQQYSLYPAWFNHFDLLVTAVPGFMGHDTLKAAIHCGKPIADISFFPENSLDLDELAKQYNCTVITDCGVAPGMSNYIIGRYDAQMQIDAFEIYVGGLPEIRKKPFEYKAPFSPIDVIEEYTRPARFMENGVIVTQPALTEREWMNFDGIGTLEAFNTDGLRSLLFTMDHVKNQKEKTLRYPGHVELIIALKEGGFFDHEPIQFGDTQISPIEFSSKILFGQWKLEEEEGELTVMKVIISGKENGVPKKITYSLLDRYDPVTKVSSMSRTTGYTCTATANLLAKGMFTEKGVFPPELVGKNKDCFDFVIDYLRERGVIWKSEE
jgi:lysine 6-dehydrogenase